MQTEKQKFAQIRRPLFLYWNNKMIVSRDPITKASSNHAITFAFLFVVNNRRKGTCIYETQLKKQTRIYLHYRRSVVVMIEKILPAL